MESSSGRTLTSFGPDSSDAPATSTETSRSTRTGTTIDDQDVDNAPFTATALDFAYRAFAARDAVNVSVPPLYTNAQAVDSASFAGQGATFSVYRRRIPQRKFKTKVNMGGWSIEVEEPLKLPEVVAYKVAMIDFTEIGEAADHASRRAINAAVMELHLSAHPPILKHPNLVDFFGLAWGSNPFHTSHKLPALIVEFAECGSLSDLQRRECLNLEMRRKLCLDVCQGLYMLHSCGVVHGDVKADNVLIFPDAKQKYVAKVSDFGFSFITSAREDGLRLGGTRPWKAPEAKEAIKVSDAKYTDVYSLALLIWCTFAHGQNIFRLLIDPAKQGEDFYAEAERIKETGQLAARTGLEDWYLKALTSSSYGDQAQIMAYLASAPQRIQNLMSQPDNIMGAVSGMEELLCAIPPMFTGALAQAQQQLIAIIQQSGLYSAMQQAVAIGLSTDPSQRSLANIMVALGHSGSFPAYVISLESI